MNKPLTGIRVIDCTFFAAGPSCGRTLAEWGAEVIKIEPPGGEPNHDRRNPDKDIAFEAYNYGKKDIVINSKDPKGYQLMMDLIATADVFMTSYRTVALKKLGLDYETLSAKYPRLVWGSINGFGDEGPDAEAPGFDTVAYWAKSGLMNDFVSKGAPIVIPPVAFGDMSAGATLAGGIAAALFSREKTGRGDKVMVSLYGLAVYGLTSPLSAVQRQSNVFPGDRTQPAIALMNSYKCKDGKWVYMAVLEYERYFPVLMKLIGREDLINDPILSNRVSAYDHRPELTAVMDEGFSKYTQDEWCEMLTKADIAFSTVRQVADIPGDPQALANNYIAEYTYRDGSKEMYTTSPVKFGSIDLDALPPAPRTGEDTVAILRDLGYSEEQVGQMIASGVVQAV